MATYPENPPEDAPESDAWDDAVWIAEQADRLEAEDASWDSWTNEEQYRRG